MASASRLFFVAAISGFLCVAFGAFVGHRLQGAQALAYAQTGFDYQALHTLAAIGAALLARTGSRTALSAGWLFLFGTAIFCGSLYAMALGAPRVLGFATPIGGVSFMVGWGLLARAAWSSGKSSNQDAKQ
ncbi:MAG: DUF423 domain-containing protein [Caulobacterales bacterium]|jgi:uncharacterized membrane protein YgdD (TMEM256/DUF423 family)